MSKRSGFKRIAAAVLKHTHSNVGIYATMIGALTQQDYVAALGCLKLILLRETIAAIQRRMQAKKDTDDQTKT